MKNILHSLRVSLVVFALLAVYAMPSAAQASLPGFNGGTLGLLTGLDTQIDPANVTTGGTSTFNFNSCSLSTNFSEIVTGGSVDLTWSAQGFDSVVINGHTVSGGAGVHTVTNITQTTIFELVASSSAGDCVQTVEVICIPPVLVCDLDIRKTVDKAVASPGDELTYTITVENEGTGPCTGGVKVTDVLQPNIEYMSYSFTGDITPGYGTKPVYDSSTRTLYFDAKTLDSNESATITIVVKVSEPTQCGDFTVTNQARAYANEIGSGLTPVTSSIVSTDIDFDCPLTPDCLTFDADPSTIVSGNSSTLSWTTINASRVVINNGVGEVNANDSLVVSPLTNTTYVLSVFDGANTLVKSCETTVTVSDDPIPVCEKFEASPAILPFGGGTVTLDWRVTGATSVSIAPTVGAVNPVDSTTVSVTDSTNFILTAVDGNGDQITCPAPVEVLPETPVFSCENNVSFTASDNSIRRGDSSNLSWNVTDADTVSISSIGSVALVDSTSVSPSSDTTYTLTATKGNDTVNCPLTINVSTGGGGGGSSSPRCELEISDTTITRGEEITLTWDTTRAREVKLVDDRGTVLFDTDDMLADDKEEYEEGEITLRPTRDTKYTLTVERGSRDRECEVEVEVDGGLTVLQTRDQQPLVAGIALSNVPYTGFEAGPVLTLMFYLLLMAWALYVAYFLVLRQRSVVNNSPVTVSEGPSTIAGTQNMKNAENTRPDAFPQAVTASTATAVPTNLPTGTDEPKTVGYESYFGGTPVSMNTVDAVVTELENRAHEQKALLSSDAIEYFMKSTEGDVERNEALDAVISESKKHYPLEDGWIVINEARMQSLCETCVAPTNTAPEQHLPTGTGSLAEAILTGNVAAAYEMIGNRPMFSLADAAADLDTVVRSRQGKASVSSELLKRESAKLSDTQLENMIKALTGALDGTYSDEASAVKMAIMKAVKELA